MTYLAPDPSPAPVPVYEDALENVFHDFISGITGIAGSLVRPRWQAFPPNQPDFGTDWCAFGIQVTEADTFPFLGHEASPHGGLGADTLERDEFFKILHSFYGPNASAMQSRYRDGAQIEFNRYALTAAGVKLRYFLEATTVPALLKERWVKRVDVMVMFSRRVKRSYSVPSLVGGSLGLDNEHYVTPIIISPPP